MVGIQTSVPSLYYTILLLTKESTSAPNDGDDDADATITTTTTIMVPALVLLSPYLPGGHWTDYTCRTRRYLLTTRPEFPVFGQTQGLNPTSTSSGRHMGLSLESCAITITITTPTSFIPASRQSVPS